MTSTQPPDAAWQEHFARLDAILQDELPLAEKLTRCAAACRSHLETAEVEPALRREMENGILSFEQAARNDFSGVSHQFRRIVSTPLEEAGGERLLFLIIKNINPEKEPSPLVIRCTLDERTLKAQEVLRSAEFIGELAARLGVESYSPEAHASRVQGVNILNHAGHVRYALFADLVHEMEWASSYVDGGLLFSATADEFVEHDLPTVDALFPEEGRRLRRLGATDPQMVKSLFNIFLVLHDTLGHTAPHPVHHWVKRLTGPFLLDPFEELGADTQFFWMASAERMKPFLAQILTPEEAEALPLLWLMKRVCHYSRRGIEEDPLHGTLMKDGDARTGVLFWQYFLQHGVIVRQGDHFLLDRELFPAGVERLLDEWLAVESKLPGGVESYIRALSDFYLKYRSSDQESGKWAIPYDLRHTAALN